MKRFVTLATVILVVAATAYALKTRQYGGGKFVDITTDTLTDSSYVKDTTWLLGDASQYRSYMLRVVIGAAPSTAHGFGNKDTARIVVKTQFRDMYYTLDSVLKTSIPCTLLTSKIINDTLIKENMILMLYMADTCSDTIQTTKYPVKWDLIVKE